MKDKLTVHGETGCREKVQNRVDELLAKGEQCIGCKVGKDVFEFDFKNNSGEYTEYFYKLQSLVRNLAGAKQLKENELSTEVFGGNSYQILTKNNVVSMNVVDKNGYETYFIGIDVAKNHVTYEISGMMKSHGKYMDWIELTKNFIEDNMLDNVTWQERKADVNSIRNQLHRQKRVG